MLTGRQAEEARAGIDLLARCRENVQQVTGIKAKLERSISTSEQALPQYPALRKAWVVRRNLERTKVDLDAILVMPVELARIELELTRLTEGAVGEHGDGSASSTASERSSSDSDSDKSVSDQVASHTRKVPGPRNARAQAGVEAARRRGVDGKSFARLSPAMLRAPTRQRWAYMSGARIRPT
jgi:hypothetical protein